MSNAVFAGRTFRIDPTSVSGAFTIKTRATPTVGGRVVHIYGTMWNHLVVSGSFGRGGFAEQSAFLDRMSALIDTQIGQPKEAASTFIWPERGWNFKVYLSAYNSPTGGPAVEINPAIIAPKWQLTFFVVEDHGVLKQFVKNTYLERLLTSGLGWKQTTYNGPLQDATGFYQLPGSQSSSTPAPTAPSGSGGVRRL